MFQAPMLAMCSVIGIISRQGRDVSENAFQMLSALKDRGPEGFGIIAPEREKKSKSLGRLRPMPSSEIILGHCLLSITGKGTQPFASQSKKFSLAHNGEIYNYRELSSKKVQSDCDHDFKRIMVLDEHYCSRLDGRGRGEEEVFVGEKCAKCNFFRQRKRGHPWQVCFKCGGPMKHNRMELFGQDRVHVNKCQDCGHEHDTT